MTPKSNNFSLSILCAFLIIVSLHGCMQVENASTLIKSDQVISRITFGSCAFQWEEQPIWNTIGESNPNLFLFIGDAIYGDWDGQKVYDFTEETLKREWGMLGANKNFRRFRSKFPILATWDNHDYGKHDGGADFEKKELTKQIFLDFFGEPAESERRQSAGIYDARIFGPEDKRVQIILLDTRWFKSPFKKDPRSKEELKKIGKVGKYVPNTDLDATLLGSAQWQWLEEQLRKPAEIRFIVSSTQIIANEKGMDEWGDYPADRQKLFDLIESTKANGVILLSGNVHFAELSKTDEGPYPLYDFTSSGLTHVEEAYGKAANSFRVAGPYIDLNFGLVEIDWEAKPVPRMLFKAIGLNGGVAFERDFDLNLLKN
jgi:alkaline phosphatase D